MGMVWMSTDTEDTNVNVGLVYLWNGRFKKPAECFSECMKIAPGNEWAKLGKAFILDFRGDGYTAEGLIGECSQEKVDWFKRRLTQSYTNEKVGNLFKEWVCPRPALQVSLDSHSAKQNNQPTNIYNISLTIISILILFYLITHFYLFGLSFPFLSYKTESLI
eukprot:TRINITY_DN14786_c0_g1_i2.p1 TRINITY_DN14786_c0_g1~~TRINITY_DN14786_c0_g1_i2.p1  ORF type:complete len:163 (-),score=32.19 TRINITY_DN14786_c0_g1_i2:69-557(-)